MILLFLLLFLKMPKKQQNEDDQIYFNDETILLKKEINILKKQLRQFKKENNDEMIVKLKELIAIKEDEYDKIQFSLFAKDMQQYKNFKLYMPRQSN